MNKFNPGNARNRYGATAARIHKASGRARRPASKTIDVHAHVVIPEAAAHATPHLDLSTVPLAHFSDAIGRAINGEQEQARRDALTRTDVHLRDMDAMGVDVQLLTPAPNQCYYSVETSIAQTAHRLANEGVARLVAQRPDRFAGMGVVTLQEPELAVRELETSMLDLGLKGVQILTNVNGIDLSDERFLPFFARAEELGAFLMLHPNGFTQGQRLERFYLNNVLGNPLETTIALHHLILSGVLHRYPDLKLMAVHGGAFLASYWGRLDHAWGARDDAHAGLPLPPSTYLRRIYVDTVVFSSEQLKSLIDLFGRDHVLMGTDYPFDMAEYDPIGHIAGIEGVDDVTLSALSGGNAARLLGL